LSLQILLCVGRTHKQTHCLLKPKTLKVKEDFPRFFSHSSRKLLLLQQKD